MYHSDPTVALITYCYPLLGSAGTLEMLETMRAIRSLPTYDKEARNATL